MRTRRRISRMDGIDVPLVSPSSSRGTMRRATRGGASRRSVSVASGSTRPKNRYSRPSRSVWNPSGCCDISSSPHWSRTPQSFGGSPFHSSRISISVEVRGNSSCVASRSSFTRDAPALTMATISAASACSKRPTFCTLRRSEGSVSAISLSRVLSWTAAASAGFGEPREPEFTAIREGFLARSFAACAVDVPVSTCDSSLHPMSDTQASEMRLLKAEALLTFATLLRPGTGWFLGPRTAPVQHDWAQPAAQADKTYAKSRLRPATVRAADRLLSTCERGSVSTQLALLLHTIHCDTCSPHSSRPAASYEGRRGQSRIAR